MTIFGYQTTYGATHDASKSRGQPHQAEQILRSILLVLPCLHAQYGICDDVDKSLREVRHSHQCCEGAGVAVSFFEEDGHKADELNKAHDDQVGPAMIPPYR